jgi:threonine/homoserine/homoserine lactone efflux protein
LVLVITTVFTLNNLVAFLAWTLAGDWLAQQFRDEQNARRINRLFGIVLAGVAIWMALS